MFVYIYIYIHVPVWARMSQMYSKHANIDLIQPTTSCWEKSSGWFGSCHETSLTYLSLFIYPLVNQHSYGKSPFLKGKSIMNGHFQYLC